MAAESDTKTRSGPAEASGFLTYKLQHLAKINSMRRAASQPSSPSVPVPTKGQVLYIPAGRMQGRPATCYNCPFYNYGRSCKLIGPHTIIRKFVYPPDPVPADSKPIEYWPCCGMFIPGEPNYGAEEFLDRRSSPEDLGLVWINAPEVGQEYGGATCAGINGGDDCDSYCTKSDDKRSEPQAFCRVLQGEVEGGAVCASWADDDQLDNAKAQSLLRELDSHVEPREFASTQINILRGAPAWEDQQKAAAELRDQDLAPDGREDNPHITVRFGLLDDSPEAIDKLREAVRSIKPFYVVAGKVHIFPAGKDGVPIVNKIQSSPELEALRECVEEVGDFKADAHPEYVPHVTLGYVQPGTEERYKGTRGMEGSNIRVDHLTVSTRDRREIQLPFAGLDKQRVLMILALRHEARAEAK